VKCAIAAVKKASKHAQGTICYTVSPLYTVEGYVQMAKELMDLSCDSRCIKDMASLLKPSRRMTL
jgi:methylmalonyl-CoA carboxyltransferase 5S subunit